MSTLGLSDGPPTQQHDAPSAEPPNLGLLATVTCAQQGGPTSSAASADKCCISSHTELKQITPEQSPMNLSNILQVIYFWCGGGGERTESDVRKPSLDWKVSEYQQGKGCNQARLACSVPAEPGRLFPWLEGKEDLRKAFKFVYQSICLAPRAFFFKEVTHKRGSG